MSHIGKNPIMIPENIKIEINNNYLIITGKLGILIKKIPENIDINIDNNKLLLKNQNNLNNALWGTFRVLINNMILGVTKGFIIKLRIVGVGYRSFIDNKYLKLKLGYTNIIKLSIPSNIKIKCIKNTIIYLYGLNLQQLKQFAFKIRSFKIPDPYKGKGILFDLEKINFKEGKKK
jgi:large subunit ribosomal protein L6